MKVCLAVVRGRAQGSRALTWPLRAIAIAKGLHICAQALYGHRLEGQIEAIVCVCVSERDARENARLYMAVGVWERAGKRLAAARRIAV